MRFEATQVDGAWLLSVEPIRDERGLFGRLWCERELLEQGLVATIRQTNVGFSARAATLRGLHYQRAPHREVKILRCTRGAVFDVVVDLRPESPTYLRWTGAELRPENYLAMYVPEGCATGYLTLEPESEVYYHTSAFYSPASASGVRWDDPAFGIDWPRPPEILSAQDRNWPDYQHAGGMHEEDDE